jgi:hypothetical protein
MNLQIAWEVHTLGWVVFSAQLNKFQVDLRLQVIIVILGIKQVIVRCKVLIDGFQQWLIFNKQPIHIKIVIFKSFCPHS